MALHLVTGGTGFIGSHLVRALVERGDRVRVLDDLSSGRRENLSGLELGSLGSGAPVELYIGDVANPAEVAEACRGVEGVLHEAALVSVPDSMARPEVSFRINVTGTFELLRAARAAGVRSVVAASSSAIYGPDETVPKVESMRPCPASPYAGDKLMAETLLEVWGQSFGLRTVALRYFNVFGPGQSDDSPYSGVIALFVRSCLAGQPVGIHGDGGQTRDFVFVDDVVQANLLALDSDLGGEVFNVGSGEAVRIDQLLREVARCTGREAEVSHGPARAGDVRHSLASIERIGEALGYRPGVTRAQGLERTVDWYRGK